MCPCAQCGGLGDCLCSFTAFDKNMTIGEFLAMAAERGNNPEEMAPVGAGGTASTCEQAAAVAVTDLNKGAWPVPRLSCPRRGNCHAYNVHTL